MLDRQTEGSHSCLWQASAEWTAKVLRTSPEAAIGPRSTAGRPPLESRQLITAVQVQIPCLRTGAPREPQALPPTEATGNVGEKAQVAGRQVRGPEADRLLTLEHMAQRTASCLGMMLWRPPTVTPALSCGCLLPGPWAVQLMMCQPSAWSASTERRRNWRRFHCRGQSWGGQRAGGTTMQPSMQELRGLVMMFMGPVCPGLLPPPPSR